MNKLTSRVHTPLQDIFTIEYEETYQFVMSGGYEITGTVVDVCPNGLVLSDGTRVVQEHIILFKPIKNV